MEAPLGIVVEVTREALAAPCVSAATYDAAVSLFECRFLSISLPFAGTYASTAALPAVFDMQLDRGETHLLPGLE
jgi:hypothetical protein